MLFSFAGSVVKLEVPRGHDGFLRGCPEPVMALAAYSVVVSREQTVVQVIGRSLHRFKGKTSFPSDFLTSTEALPSCTWPFERERAVWAVVLAVALEQDGGRDVQRLFGALEHHRTLAFWGSESEDVCPLSIGAIVPSLLRVGAPDFVLPTSVHLQIEGQDAEEACRSDKWIGAVAWAMPCRLPAAQGRYRLPFLSHDRRNDWTAIVDIVH